MAKSKSTPREDLPHVVHTGTIELMGHKLTTHVLSDGSRIYADTPEFRALLAELGATMTDKGIVFGPKEAVDVEWTEHKPAEVPRG